MCFLHLAFLFQVEFPYYFPESSGRDLLVVFVVLFFFIYPWQSLKNCIQEQNPTWTTIYFCLSPAIDNIQCFFCHPYWFVLSFLLLMLSFCILPFLVSVHSSSSFGQLSLTVQICFYVDFKSIRYVIYIIFWHYNYFGDALLQLHSHVWY